MNPSIAQRCNQTRCFLGQNLIPFFFQATSSEQRDGSTVDGIKNTMMERTRAREKTYQEKRRRSLSPGNSTNSESEKSDDALPVCSDDSQSEKNDDALSVCSEDSQSGENDGFSSGDSEASSPVPTRIQKLKILEKTVTEESFFKTFDISVENLIDTLEPMYKVFTTK